jgi:tRNA threonylcarbamoyladenosine biosynthesis protein TsaE
VIECLTTSAEATKTLAAALSAVVKGGDLIVLAGEMGAGKTAFTQGFAAGLGITEAVTSPTFTLVRQYEGRIGLSHLDVYRLDTLGEVADLGLSELLDGESVTVIEWGDVVSSVLPGDYLEVTLAFTEPDDHRFVTVRPLGAWSARWPVVVETLGPWRC